MNYKIFLLLLTNLCLGDAYSSCDSYNELNTCIDNPFCQWCNVTKEQNMTNIGICKQNSECLYNSSECISNNKLNGVCNVVDIFISMSLVFMLFGSIFYVSYVSKLILDKYFDMPYDNGEAIRDRIKEKALILTIINVLLFIPPIILWIVGSMVFLYYTIFLMGLVVLLTCSTTTRKYIRKHNQKSAYTQIN
jgi:hypothetical protein